MINLVYQKLVSMDGIAFLILSFRISAQCPFMHQKVSIHRIKHSILLAEYINFFDFWLELV